MNEQVKATSEPLVGKQSLWLWALLAAAFSTLLVIYRNGLSVLLTWWETPEYSHGYMIPLVAMFLLWQRINDLPAAMQRGSWAGVGLLATGLALHALGTLANTSTIVQYGFLLSLYGIALAFIGWRAMKLIWVVPFYLLFMIPLPNFFYISLSTQMQLISSEIGVAFIRLFGVSVYLEGNVIDLGPMQLQVAEACSGMRYLFPLMSFGFLIAYLYRGPLWQRIFLFVSTIPITILMNSFRIGVIGLTVDKWGIEMAEGFLHDFEGWVVFMGCVLVLFAEIMLFHAFQREKTRVLDKIDLDLPKVSARLKDFPVNAGRQKPFLVGFVLLAALLPALLPLKVREELPPPRKPFAEFPTTHNDWRGAFHPLSREILDILQLSDYVQINYLHNSSAIPVNFYVAWYQSQRKGSGIHSPRMCIPGGGWEIEDLRSYTVPSTRHVNGEPIQVNRTVIRKDKTAQLVYYWFEGRGRNIVDERTAKLYVLRDAMIDRRSDGALVRVVTMVPEGSSMEEADQRLQQFLKDFYPLLPAYVP